MLHQTLMSLAAFAAITTTAQAATVNIGSQSGNTITDEVLAYGWIRSDDPLVSAGGETAFVGTGGTSDFRGFVAFDLSGFTTGDTINSATLSLFADAATTFNANGGNANDANNIGLSATTLSEITGYGGGLPGFPNALLDSAGPIFFNANWTNLNTLYGAVLDTVMLDLDSMTLGQEVQLDVTAAIATAIDAGATKITLGITSPDAVATNARNFFIFEGMDQLAGDTTSALAGPNLFVDFTPVPEPGSCLLLAIGCTLLCYAKMGNTR